MQTDKKKGKARRRPLLKITLIVVLVLVIIRVLLPYAILHYANKSLSELKGYYGKVKDVDLAIIRGAYTIDNIYIHKRDTITSEESEFFDAEKVDLSIHWDALLKGKIAGEIEVLEPRLLFVKEKTDPENVKSDTTDFKKLLDDFMPLAVNRFEIKHGSIHYVDNISQPKVDVMVSNVQVKAENLTNAEPVSVLPATVTASADVYEGTFDLNMKLDPLAKSPTFDVNTEIRDLNLVPLNNFFKAYANFDINKGRFGLFVEGAAKDGKFVGYFKPLIKDLDVLGPEDKDDKLLRKFWEGVIGATGEIFQNQKKEQLATKVPIEGTFGKTTVNAWQAVIVVLRNAFIQALQPAVDQEINLGTVHGPKAKQEDLFEDKKDNKDPDTKDETPEKKGFFKRIFGGKNKEKETKDSVK